MGTVTSESISQDLTDPPLVIKQVEDYLSAAASLSRKLPECSDRTAIRCILSLLDEIASSWKALSPQNRALLPTQASSTPSLAIHCAASSPPPAVSSRRLRTAATAEQRRPPSPAGDSTQISSRLRPSQIKSGTPFTSRPRQSKWPLVDPPAADVALDPVVGAQSVPLPRGIPKSSPSLHDNPLSPPTIPPIPPQDESPTTETTPPPIDATSEIRSAVLAPPAPSLRAVPDAVPVPVAVPLARASPDPLIEHPSPSVASPSLACSPPPSPELLARVLFSRENFAAMVDLIQTWRRRDQLIRDLNGDFSLAHVGRVIKASHDAKALFGYFLRVSRTVLARHGDRLRGSRERLANHHIKSQLRGLQWEDTRVMRAKLYYETTVGREWGRVCSGHPGLLCLIPFVNSWYLEAGPDPVIPVMYRTMSAAEIAIFHDQVDHIPTEFGRALFRTATIFHRAVTQHQPLPEFRWESENLDRLGQLSDDELALWMHAREDIPSNEYQSAYTWPEPPGWIGPWPRDPTLVTPDNNDCPLCRSSSCGCDICHAPCCECIRTQVVGMIPRIGDEGAGERGVRVSGEPFKCGQMLGELLGELVPPRTFPDGGALDIVRPDLPGEPTVAQLYPRHRGNWVGLLNYSCSPNAGFTVRKISGRWRAMLVATRDTGVGDEITVACGSHFAKDRICVCGACKLGLETPVVSRGSVSIAWNLQNAYY